MKILVACEESGIVRDAFRAKGHDAWSCDIQPTSSLRDTGKHFEFDVNLIISEDWMNGPTGWQWDMMIAFPPCTHLASSGARWFKEKQVDGRQQVGIDFFMEFVRSSIPKVAIENPIGIMSTNYRKPDQIVQPWQFGHGETKGTCLWLKGLPKLKPTNIVNGREQRVWKMGPSPERAKLRSKTYQGIADAMAEQWG